jgi:glutathione S-transferase
MITVWGRRNSVNVQKVLWALGELDVPYVRENVGGHFGGNRDPDFLAMNPMGLVPVIRDGDVTMFESNAIAGLPRAMTLEEWNRIERESA